MTEKAFPENEAVLTSSFSRSARGVVSNEFLYERRVGRRGQYEIAVPLSGRKLGTPESFTGGFVLEESHVAGAPAVFGPFQIDRGLASVMRSASGFEPTEGAHIR